MDLDALVSVYGKDWKRLETLCRRRRLSMAEADELVDLYQRTATHLSMVQSAAPDPALVAWLSGLVSRARGRISSTGEPLWRELARLFLVSFPAAVYRTRGWSTGSAVASIAVGVAIGWWVAVNPPVQAAVGSPQEIRQLVTSDFAAYYSENAAAGFAAQVWTNNAWVAAMCFVLGVTGIGVVWVLLNNAVNVGLVGGLMAANDRLDLFFGLILPHGLLELTAVFVAAGSGLSVCWAWVAPGPRPRAQALAQQGRAMVTVAMGLVVVLFVSAGVEAFVTPSGLPTGARIGIGAGVWGIFLVYVGVLGRAAVAAGEVGDLRAELVGDVRPVAG